MYLVSVLGHSLRPRHWEEGNTLSWILRRKKRERKKLTVVVTLQWESWAAEQPRDFPKIPVSGTKSRMSLPHGESPKQHSTEAILLRQWQSSATALTFLAMSLASAMGTKSEDASTLGEGLWPTGCAFCFLLLPQKEGNCPFGLTKWHFTVEQRDAKSVELVVRNLGSESWQYHQRQIK